MSEASKLPISVILVARNEERNLPRCLASVASWVSEIVVLLNNTTDKSEEIAQSYGARVVHRPWMGMRDTKNAVLALATQSWVLSLDADEEVSADLIKEIQGFFEAEGDVKCDGAFFPRCTWFLGKWIRHGDWYPDRVLRLFRRDRGKFSGAAGHDNVEVSGNTARFKNDLLHYSFRSLADQTIKMNWFADQYLKSQLEKDPNRKWSILNIIFRPWWRFFRAYFIKLGFLDGFPGLYIAVASYFSTFLKYSRLYEHRYPCNPPTQK